MSVNKVILLGNVGQDPIIRTTQDGKKIASLTLATSEKWKDKTSKEVKEKTEWHKVVVFADGLANIVEKYVAKGSKLYIEGQLQTRQYQDNGVQKYITETVLKGFGCKLEMLNSGNKSENIEPQVESEPSGIEDDIPF